MKQITIEELVNESVLLRTKSGKLTMSKDYIKLVAEIAHHDNQNGEINSLSGSLRGVYMIVKNNPGIKIKKVAELRKKSESTAAKQLADLKKKQLVEYRGANKTGGYYVMQPERMADRYSPCPASPPPSFCPSQIKTVFNKQQQ